MSRTSPKLAWLLYSSSLISVFLCGCHSDGTVSPQPMGLFPPTQGGANPQGVGAVQLDDRQKLNIQFALGKTLEGRGELEQAEAVYRKILDEHLEHRLALHRLAVVCGRQKRFQESEEFFRQALKADAKNAAVRGDFGYSLYLQRRWSEAEEQLQAAVRLDPENRRAHNHLGLVLAATHRPDEALAEFARAGCTPAQAQANLGLVAELNGRLGEARKAYEAASQADPANADLSRRIARLKESPSPPDSGIADLPL